MPTIDIKKTLDIKKAELEKRKEAIDADLHKQRSKSFNEQSIERENDDVLESLLLETQQELQQINTALQRLAAGEYGKCSQCGVVIAEQRLLALPAANTCITCAG